MRLFAPAVRLFAPGVGLFAPGVGLFAPGVGLWLPKRLKPLRKVSICERDDDMWLVTHHDTPDSVMTHQTASAER